MVLELKGWKTIFPNKVYAKESKKNLAKVAKVPVINFILPSRYRNVNKEEVKSYLIKKVNEIASISHEEISCWRSVKGRSQFEGMLVDLREKPVYRSLMKSHSFIDSLIDKNISDIDEEQKDFFSIGYCFLQKDIIDACKKEIDINGPLWYRHILVQDPSAYRAKQGLQWNLIVTLHNQALPEKSFIDKILKDEKESVERGELTNSDLKIYRRHEYNPKIFREVFDNLYISGLDRPEIMSKLEDETESMLTIYAGNVIRPIHDLIIPLSIKKIKETAHVFMRSHFTSEEMRNIFQEYKALGDKVAPLPEGNVPKIEMHSIVFAVTMSYQLKKGSIFEWEKGEDQTGIPVAYRLSKDAEFHGNLEDRISNINSFVALKKGMIKGDYIPAEQLYSWLSGSD